MINDTRRVNRHRDAAMIFERVRQILAGLENHPEALKKIHDRPSKPTLKRVLRQFMDFEKKREKAEQQISEANLAEKELLDEIAEEIKHLQQRIRAHYAHNPDILTDFLGEG